MRKTVFLPLSLLVGLCAGCHRRVIDPNSGRFITSSTDAKSDQTNEVWYLDTIWVNGKPYQVECKQRLDSDVKVCKAVR